MNPADLPFPDPADILRLTSGEVYDLLLRTEASIMNVITHDEFNREELMRMREKNFRIAIDRARAVLPHLSELAKERLTLCLNLAAEFAARIPKTLGSKDKIIGALEDVKDHRGDGKIESDLVWFCHALSDVAKLFH